MDFLRCAFQRGSAGINNNESPRGKIGRGDWTREGLGRKRARELGSVGRW